MELSKINLLGEGSAEFFGDIFALDIGPVKKTDQGLFYDLTLTIDPLFDRITHSVHRTLESFRWEEA